LFIGHPRLLRMQIFYILLGVGAGLVIVITVTIIYLRRKKKQKELSLLESEAIVEGTDNN